jgi:hypothetical protein
MTSQPKLLSAWPAPPLPPESAPKSCPILTDDELVVRLKQLKARLDGRRGELRPPVTT